MQTNSYLFPKNRGFGQHECVDGFVVLIVDLSESVISEDNCSVVILVCTLLTD